MGKLLLTILLFLVVILEGKEYRVLESEAIFYSKTICKQQPILNTTLCTNSKIIKGYKNYYGSYDKYKVSTHPLHIVKVR